jgi:hypothetical protein
MKQTYSLEEALSCIEKKKKRRKIAVAAIIIFCVLALPFIRIANQEIEKMKEAETPLEMKEHLIKALSFSGIGFAMCMGVPMMTMAFMPTKPELALSEFINQSTKGTEPVR